MPWIFGFFFLDACFYFSFLPWIFLSFFARITTTCLDYHPRICGLPHPILEFFPSSFFFFYPEHVSPLRSQHDFSFVLILLSSFNSCLPSACCLLRHSLCSLFTLLASAVFFFFRFRCFLFLFVLCRLLPLPCIVSGPYGPPSPLFSSLLPLPPRGPLFSARRAPGIDSNKRHNNNCTVNRSDSASRNPNQKQTRSGN